MITITIQEIVNGYTVEEFDTDGSPDLDRTVFLKEFSEVIEEVVAWACLQREALENKDVKIPRVERKNDF